MKLSLFVSAMVLVTIGGIVGNIFSTLVFRTSGGVKR